VALLNDCSGDDTVEVARRCWGMSGSNGPIAAKCEFRMAHPERCRAAVRASKGRERTE
jgi:hypothetical protein